MPNHKAKSQKRYVRYKRPHVAKRHPLSPVVHSDERGGRSKSDKEKLKSSPPAVGSDDAAWWHPVIKWW
jgi:hypothetical protein